MTDIYRLIDRLASQEQSLREQVFLAPCVRGGKVRTRLAGLVHTFTPEPNNREGWGLFKPQDATTVRWIGNAELAQIDAYLRLLKPLRCHLALRLRYRTWLAYPVNEADARQRLNRCQPLLIHLVEQTAALETVIARWDGAAFWFEALDRRADPLPAETAREALHAALPPETLSFKNLTPELRVAYTLALNGDRTYQARKAPRTERDRLQDALSFAGGRLRDFQDQGDYWVVEWNTQDGERHTSAIAKRDLTVLSAGICLDGEDRRFDLQSLVGVMEQRPDWV
ncbi:MAG: hypothetical protein R3F37_08875 [Candidatus Competibacteraceae bacterium]